LESEPHPLAVPEQNYLEHCCQIAEFRQNHSKKSIAYKIGGRKITKLSKNGRKEAGIYFCNYLEEITCKYVHFLRFVIRNERKIFSNIELLLLSMHKRCIKYFYFFQHCFCRWSDFSKISRYFGRKTLKQSGNSGLNVPRKKHLKIVLCPFCAIIINTVIILFNYHPFKA
jgi:hypothetical protein